MLSTMRDMIVRISLPDSLAMGSWRESLTSIWTFCRGEKSCNHPWDISSIVWIRSRETYQPSSSSSMEPSLYLVASNTVLLSLVPSAVGGDFDFEGIVVTDIVWYDCFDCTRKVPISIGRR